MIIKSCLDGLVNQFPVRRIEQLTLASTVMLRIVSLVGSPHNSDRFLADSNYDAMLSDAVGVVAFQSYGMGDVIGCYLDLDNQTIKWSKNGKSLL